MRSSPPAPLGPRGGFQTNAEERAQEPFAAKSYHALPCDGYTTIGDSVVLQCVQLYIRQIKGWANFFSKWYVPLIFSMLYSPGSINRFPFVPNIGINKISLDMWISYIVTYEIVGLLTPCSYFRSRNYNRVGNFSTWMCKNVCMNAVTYLTLNFSLSESAVLCYVSNVV